MPFRSWSLPRRRKGVASTTRSPMCCRMPALILVGKKPGQMQLTVMLCSARVAARARVKLTTAPLLVLYGSVDLVIARDVAGHRHGGNAAVDQVLYRLLEALVAASGNRDARPRFAERL